MKNKSFFIFLFLIIIFSSFTYAVGTCELDKYSYNPGESPLFDCSCTSPIEENRVGYFVWFNDNGTILSSILTNSGPCRTSFFGNSYVFDNDANFTGNVTFSLNSDGTGKPINWDDLDDINYDTFNVSGATITECLIEWETLPNPRFNLGQEASLSIEVEDAITKNKLINAMCTLHIESLNDTHIFSVPYEKTGFENGLKSTANGEVAFEKLLDIEILQPNTNYLVRAYCWCGANGTGKECYIDNGATGGDVSGFKSCTSTILAGSTANDFRTQKTDYLPITIVVLGLIFILIVFSFNVDEFIYNYDYKSKDGSWQNFGIPIGKLFIWSIILWLLPILINIGVINDKINNLTLTNTMNVLYKTIIYIDYFVFAMWFIFILYWGISKIYSMAGEVSK